MKSPIGWPGGKTKLAPAIVEYIHATPHKVYVEPFMGSLAVLFAKSPHVSTSEVVNDAHKELVNYFFVVKTKPKAFLRAFRWDLHAEAYWHYLNEQDPAELGDVQRAHRFHYLLKASFGQRFGDTLAVGSNSGSKEYVQLGRLDIPKVKRMTLDAHHRLKRVVITCRDYIEMSAFDGASSLYYLDPPYLDTTQRGYGGVVRLGEFWSWADSIKGKVIVSHEPNKRFDRTFKDWNRLTVGQRTTSLSRNKKGRKRVAEFLYFNYEPPIERRSLF